MPLYLCRLITSTTALTYLSIYLNAYASLLLRDSQSCSYIRERTAALAFALAFWLPAAGRPCLVRLLLALRRSLARRRLGLLPWTRGSWSTTSYAAPCRHSGVATALSLPYPHSRPVPGAAARPAAPAWCRRRKWASPSGPHRSRRVWAAGSSWYQRISPSRRSMQGGSRHAALRPRTAPQDPAPLCRRSWSSRCTRQDKGRSMRWRSWPGRWVYHRRASL
jgi:hypothetical protein